MQRCNFKNFICYFNSHAHVERDSRIFQSNVKRKISTHTLTWSVTFKTYSVFNHSKNFNSHAHVERDKLPPLLQNQLLHFNSHAHVERDAEVAENSYIHMISTHTLTWSVTTSSIARYDCPMISTHTLTWSVTCRKRL